MDKWSADGRAVKSRITKITRSRIKREISPKRLVLSNEEMVIKQSWRNVRQKEKALKWG